MDHTPFEYGGLHFIPEQRFEPQGQYHRRIPLSHMGQDADANLFPSKFAYSTQRNMSQSFTVDAS